MNGNQNVEYGIINVIYIYMHYKLLFAKWLAENRTIYSSELEIISLSL